MVWNTSHYKTGTNKLSFKLSLRAESGRPMSERGQPSKASSLIPLKANNTSIISSRLASLRCCIPRLSHRPAHSPRERLLLLAWSKSNQKIKPQKSFRPLGKTPWPAFCGRPLPAFSFRLYLFYVLIKNRLFHLYALLRQQKSFGRNRVKQWWPVRLQGIANICRSEAMQLFAAPVLPDLQGKGYERKEASLLTWFFGSFSSKEKELGPPAAMSGTILQSRTTHLSKAG